MAVEAAKPKLSEAHQAFYIAIGRAITAFSNVERVTGQTFAAAVYDTSKAAIDAFFEIPTFEFKLRAATAAVKAALADKPEFIDRWKKLKNRAKAAAEKRNTIAHNTIWLEHPGKESLSRKDPDNFPNAKPWIASIHITKVESIAQTQKFDSNRMDVAQIVAAERLFVALTHDINGFANDVGAVRRKK